LNSKDDFKLMIKEMQLAGYNVHYDGNRRAVAPVKPKSSGFLSIFTMLSGPMECHLRIEPFSCMLLVKHGNYIGEMKRLRDQEVAAKTFRDILDKYGV
jgi:hypothetical protein